MEEGKEEEASLASATACSILTDADDEADLVGLFFRA